MTIRVIRHSDGSLPNPANSPTRAQSPQSSPNTNRLGTAILYEVWSDADNDFYDIPFICTGLMSLRLMLDCKDLGSMSLLSSIEPPSALPGVAYRTWKVEATAATAVTHITFQPHELLGSLRISFTGHTSAKPQRALIYCLSNTAG